MRASSPKTTILAPNPAGFGTHGVGQEEPVSVSITELIRQRSMLVILISACTTARTAFEAADNVVDAQLCADLNQMIERSESELEKLTLAIGQVDG